MGSMHDTPPEMITKDAELAAYGEFVKTCPPKKKNREAYENEFRVAVQNRRFYLALALARADYKPSTYLGFVDERREDLVQYSVFAQMFHHVLGSGTLDEIRTYLSCGRLHQSAIFTEMQKNERCKGVSEIYTGLIADMVIAYKSYSMESKNFFLIPLLEDHREDVFKGLLDKDLLSSQMIDHIIDLTRERNIAATGVTALLQAELRKRDMIAAGVDPAVTHQWLVVGTDTAVQKKTVHDLSSTVTREFNFQSQTVLVKIKDADGLCCTETPFGHYDPTVLQLAYKELCDRVPNPAPFKPEKVKFPLDFTLPKK